MTTIYIYALIDPITGDLFYIGATCNPKARVASHIGTSKIGSSQKDEKIKEIISLGHKLDYEIVDRCDVDNVNFVEDFYIELFTDLGYSLLQKQQSRYCGNHRHKKLAASPTSQYPVYIPRDKITEIKRTANWHMMQQDQFIKLAIDEALIKYKPE